MKESSLAVQLKPKIACEIAFPEKYILKNASLKFHFCFEEKEVMCLCDD